MDSVSDGLIRANLPGTLAEAFGPPAQRQELGKYGTQLLCAIMQTTRHSAGKAVVLGSESTLKLVGETYEVKRMSSILAARVVDFQDVDFFVIDERYFWASGWRRFASTTGELIGELASLVDACRTHGVRVTVWSVNLSPGVRLVVPGAIYLPNPTYDWDGHPGSRPPRLVDMLNGEEKS